MSKIKCITVFLLTVLLLITTVAYADENITVTPTPGETFSLEQLVGINSTQAEMTPVETIVIPTIEITPIETPSDDGTVPELSVVPTPIPTYVYEDPFIEPEPIVTIAPPVAIYERVDVLVSISNFFKTIQINTNKMIQLPVFRNADTQEVIAESEITSTTTDGNIEVSVANNIPVVYSQGDEIVIIRTQ